MRLPNLLPPENNTSYRLYLTSLYLRRLLQLQVVLAAVLLAVLAGQQYYLKQKLVVLNREVLVHKAATADFDIEDLQFAVNRETDRLKGANEILAVRPELSIYIDEVVKLLPAGVTLDSLSVSAVERQMSVQGRAAKRESIVVLQSRLAQSPLLNVLYDPLSNLTESRDAPFYFILKFKAEPAK